MCGRYTLVSPIEAIQSIFDIPGSLSALEQRFNLAPTQDAPVVRVNSESKARELASLRWGLLPVFAKDLAYGSRLINARSETAASKPSFRSAFRKRRCLVIADGFYEWAGSGGSKRPHRFSLKTQEPFGMAGLWESWRPSGDASAIETFTILTCEGNGDVAPIHHRMPVILAPGNFDRWLDPDCEDPEMLQSVLRPLPAGLIHCIEVSTHVNSVRNNDARCLEPVAGLF